MDPGMMLSLSLLRLVVLFPSSISGKMGRDYR
jgi:hypothetical protein